MLIQYNTPIYQEPLLRVVRLIPYILRFITILTEMYHRRIDRSEADELPIKDLFGKIKHGECKEMVVMTMYPR